MTDYFGTHRASPIARPQHVTLNTRATLCHHTGEPIFQTYNPVYGYYATHRRMRKDEVARWLPGYEGNMQSRGA